MQRIVNMQVNMQVLALDMMIIMRRVQVLAVWFYYCLLLLLLLLLLRSLLGGILLLARFCLGLLLLALKVIENLWHKLGVWLGIGPRLFSLGLAFFSLGLALVLCTAVYSPA